MSFSAQLVEETDNFAGLLASVRERLRPGIEAGAALIEAEAKQNVPVVSGDLRDHIHTETEEESPNTLSLLVAPAVTAGNLEGFDPAYARRVEMGFVGADSKGRVFNQPAQPFMRTAGDEQGEAALDAASAELAKGLEV